MYCKLMVPQLFLLLLAVTFAVGELKLLNETILYVIILSSRSCMICTLINTACAACLQQGGSSCNDAVISAACRAWVISPLRMSDSVIPLDCAVNPMVSALYN